MFNIFIYKIKYKNKYIHVNFQNIYYMCVDLYNKYTQYTYYVNKNFYFGCD